LNPNWKGQDAPPEAGRKRARREYLDIGPCRICGNPEVERHHKDANTLNNDPSNIDIVCRRCHMNEDGRLEEFRRFAKRTSPAKLAICHEKRRQRTHCKNGHEYTQENTKIVNGHRVCRACAKAASYRYWLAHREAMPTKEKMGRAE
jgi:hypothetical protein